MARADDVSSDSEIIFSTKETSQALARAVGSGDLRRIARGILTSDLRAPVEQVVRAQRILQATGAFDEDPTTARIRLPEPWD